MTSPKIRLPRPVFYSLAAAFAGLFWACGENPGQVGLDYLDQQGIHLSTPLYHVHFDDFPVDSTFATEVPLNHFGESLLVVGRESNYIATARMGFEITTPAQHDSIAKGLTLRLNAVPVTVFGGAFLNSSTRGRDSLTLLVESFAWADSLNNAFAESLTVFHRRILTAPVSFSTLEARYKVRDTIRIALSAAFDSLAPDSSQTGALNHLRARIQTDTVHNWTVFVELSPLGTADSGMYRFVAQSTNVQAYNSGLWLGNYRGDTVTTATLLAPYRSGFFSVPGANYQVVHNGPSTQSLLYGVARGVHFRLDRQRLLDSLQARLGAQFPAISSSGQFDTRFYVPYAEMGLPLDSSLSKVDGPFALDMQVASDVDSLGDLDSSFRQIPIAVGQSLRLPVTGVGSGYAPVARDTLVCTYGADPLDTALRRIVLRWAIDSSVTDTFSVLPDGKRRELTLHRHTAWLHSLEVGFFPGAASASIETFFSAQGSTEPNGILDSTGAVSAVYATTKRRFWKPGADSLNVRVTRGLRALLNRTAYPGIAPDLFLMGTQRQAYDTAASAAAVPYPVLGEIDFKRQGGKPHVSLDLYLFPLVGTP